MMLREECGGNTINLHRRVQPCLARSGRHDEDRILSENEIELRYSSKVDRRSEIHVL